jgi:hypothetical protein
MQPHRHREAVWAPYLVIECLCSSVFLVLLGIDQAERRFMRLDGIILILGLARISIGDNEIGDDGLPAESGPWVSVLHYTHDAFFLMIYWLCSNEAVTISILPFRKTGLHQPVVETLNHHTTDARNRRVTSGDDISSNSQPASRHQLSQRHGDKPNLFIMHQ